MQKGDDAIWSYRIRLAANGANTSNSVSPLPSSHAGAKPPFREARRALSLGVIVSALRPCCLGNRLRVAKEDFRLEVGMKLLRVSIPVSLEDVGAD